MSVVRCDEQPDWRTDDWRTNHGANTGTCDNHGKLNGDHHGDHHNDVDRNDHRDHHRNDS